MFKLGYILFILYNNKFSSVTHKGNHISINGNLDKKLCFNVKNTINTVYEEAKKYCDEQTINYAPIVMKINSMNGHPNEIYRLVRYMNEKIKCPFYTINEKVIGGYSTHLFLAGKKKLFHKNAIIYVPHFHHEDKIEYFLDDYNNYIPMVKLNSDQALELRYCDKIIQ